MTRRSLKPEDALLVGRLVLLDVDRASTAPHLGLNVWCPYCKREHQHGWDVGDRRADVVSHRVAHCVRGPFADGGGYYIGLDPAQAEANRKVKRQCQRLRSRWEKRTASVPGGPPR